MCHRMTTIEYTAQYALRGHVSPYDHHRVYGSVYSKGPWYHRMATSSDNAMKSPMKTLHRASCLDKFQTHTKLIENYYFPTTYSLNERSVYFLHNSELFKSY